MRTTTTEFVIARVIAAYATTKLGPVTGERFWMDAQTGEKCACAVGAVSLEESRGRNEFRSVFGARTECVAYGWDDAFDDNVHTLGDDDAACPECERPNCRYYAAGAAAAIAMGAA